jgi:hypothetical protein
MLYPRGRVGRNVIINLNPTSKCMGTAMCPRNRPKPQDLEDGWLNNAQNITSIRYLQKEKRYKTKLISSGR